jgi:hypothetical protein
MAADPDEPHSPLALAEARTMTSRKRYLMIGGALLAVVAIEIGVGALRVPVATVRVVNDGAAPIEGLIVTCGKSETIVARIDSGASADVRVAGRTALPLKLRYHQRGNAMSELELPQFDPPALAREGFVLVLRIRTNEYERYQDDAEPSMWSKLGTRIQDWLNESLKSD